MKRKALCSLLLKLTSPFQTQITKNKLAKEYTRVLLMSKFPPGIQIPLLFGCE